MWVRVRVRVRVMVRGFFSFHSLRPTGYVDSTTSQALRSYCMYVVRYPVSPRGFPNSSHIPPNFRRFDRGRSVRLCLGQTGEGDGEAWGTNLPKGVALGTHACIHEFSMFLDSRAGSSSSCCCCCCCSGCVSGLHEALRHCGTTPRVLAGRFSLRTTPLD